MNHQRREELLEIAAGWALQQVDNWIGEYEAWDDLIGDDLTEEEWEYIYQNVSFEIKANIKE